MSAKPLRCIFINTFFNLPSPITYHIDHFTIHSIASRNCSNDLRYPSLLINKKLYCCHLSLVLLSLPCQCTWNGQNLCVCKRFGECELETSHQVHHAMLCQPGK